MSGTTKERPILFSGPMVRAIIAGQKTVTRRLVKMPRLLVVDGISPAGIRCSRPTGSTGERLLTCPYGVQGDRLWLRERFAPVDSTGHTCAIRDANFVVLSDGAQVYRDGTVGAALPKYAQGAFDGIIWRPSIHMPRWASRILLEVVSVRVERLHAITDEDAQREGLSRLSKDGGRVWKYGIPDRDGLPGNDDDGWHWKEWSASARTAFSTLWDKINGPRSPWASNPWVWRVEFRRVA